MQALLRLLVLAAAFGLASWAGYALAVGSREAPAAPPRSPGPVPAALPEGAAAPRGDLDGAREAPPRPAPVPAKAAEPAKPAAGGYLRLTFADLSQWDLDPRDIQVPASIRALQGKDVDIVGYMLPYGNPDAVEEFVLVKDLGSCCFGAAPLPHHLVECRFEPGKRTVYVPGPVRTRGRFRVEEHRQGQFLISIYAMTVADCVEIRWTVSFRTGRRGRPSASRCGGRAPPSARGASRATPAPGPGPRRRP